MEIRNLINEKSGPLIAFELSDLRVVLTHFAGDCSLLVHFMIGDLGMRIYCLLGGNPADCTE